MKPSHITATCSMSSPENYLASTVFADLFLFLIVFVFLLLIFAIANA
jgi:hypothetical protein